MWVVAADTPDKLPELLIVRLSVGYLCSEDRGKTCSRVTPCDVEPRPKGSSCVTTILIFRGMVQKLHRTSWNQHFLSLHRVGKLVPPHVCHFQVPKRDKLNISYLDLSLEKIRSTRRTVLLWKLQ